ncbi:MAG: hypothetical protein OXH50_16005 [Gemmatimonadetes bacterium]|nr:hypothetical protein [Gemmatimonadota bacterium]
MKSELSFRARVPVIDSNVGDGQSLFGRLPSTLRRSCGQSSAATASSGPSFSYLLGGLVAIISAYFLNYRRPRKADLAAEVGRSQSKVRSMKLGEYSLVDDTELRLVIWAA